MARALDARRRAERLLFARMGIGGERFGAGPRRRRRTRRVARCIHLDRPGACDLDVARLQDPAARFGQRRSLRHALHAAARPRHGGGSRHRHSAAGPAGRRACADLPRHLARWRGHEGLYRRAAPRRHAAAGAAIACPRLPRCDRRRRRIAARGAGREETERTAPPAQSPRRTRRRPFRRGAHACRSRPPRSKHS